MLALVVLLGCPVELLLLLAEVLVVMARVTRSLAAQMLALAMPLQLRVTSPLVPPPPIRCT